MNIQKNVPLAPFTTLNIGGPARFFVRAVADGDIAEAFAFAKENELAVFLLGAGSNVLIADQGFDGLVIQIATAGVQYRDEKDFTEVTAAAGENWDTLVEATISRGLAGFECLSGIPGSVGGTPVQNVGAYGQEVSETIVSVNCFDRIETRTVELSDTDCQFSYRRSIFNSIEKDRYVVLSVNYRLATGGRPKIVYKDLIEFFGGRKPSLAEARAAIIGIRRSKSMVIDPADPNSRSAGSFFKNPVVDKATYDGLQKASDDKPIPFFAVGGDSVKIPAAWLIENAGFSKGYKLGNAGISERHSLALINLGAATATEIVALKDLIQQKVAERFGLTLDPEPMFIGFDRA